MNLRADLIFPGEQRSASGVSLRSVSRVATIVGPLVVAGVIVYIVMNSLNLNSKVRAMERLWLETEPRKEQAMKVLQQGKANDAILKEIQGWQRSRIDWHTQLLALQRMVQPRLQFSVLRLSQVLQTGENKEAERTYTLAISGKAVGRGAETAVEGLQKDFLETEPFKEYIERAEIPKYGADPADKENRIFQLDCTYKPRVFE